MRRDELEAAGINVPVLATVCGGPLPQPGNWAMRLERLGLDVITTGAPADDPSGVAEAVAAVPFRPVLARAGDAEALAAAGARIVATDDPAPEGAYAFRSGEVTVVPIAADTPAENANDVARAVLAAARGGQASAIWVAAPDLSDVPEDIVEAKLEAMCEGTRMARMWLSKHQSDPD
jgi:hypothetical protein